MGCIAGQLLALGKAHNLSLARDVAMTGLRKRKQNQKPPPLLGPVERIKAFLKEADVLASSSPTVIMGAQRDTKMHKKGFQSLLRTSLGNYAFLEHDPSWPLFTAW